MNFPTSIQEHRDNVGRLRCVVTGKPSPTLHHAQGPSIRARLAEMGLDSTKSMSMRGNGEALLIPLDAEYHTGKYGIDTGYGRESWERDFKSQAELIDTVSELLDYDLWQLHILWMKPSKIFRVRRG